MRVLVIGLGASGRAAAAALLAAGEDVVVTDTARSDTVRAHADELAAAGATARLGAPPPDLLDEADVVVVSPGVPPSNPLLRAATASGVPVWSEPELAWRLGGGRTTVVAVTGTNGKTTTTEMLAACLAAPAAGNIGQPLVTLLAGDPPPLVVAELSSFQLRFTHTLRPRVAVLLNVAPDHLDWHGSHADYVADKARIWRAQRSGDWAVLSADDPGAVAARTAQPPPGGLRTFTAGRPASGQAGVADGVITARFDGDLPVLAVSELQAPGPHNLANAVAAAAAALSLGTPAEQIAEALRGYRPGPHRLEVVDRIDAVTYVNDSKATNPHAAEAALSSYESVVWIAGGLNKGLRFDGLVAAVRDRVRALVTIGSSAPTLAAVARRAGIPVIPAGDLAVAVPAAARAARPGDVVLLAPACASMDQFRDYAERGQAFRDAVAALKEAVGDRA